MKLINTTPYPAIAFEGIDQLNQAFHVVVMRQTYTWNDKGLLVLADEQDPLCFEDQLADSNDKMSGTLEESDLAHYKPKCDLIIKGHAYPPPSKHHQDHFYANIKLQRPNQYKVEADADSSKYIFSNKNNSKQTDDHYISGQVLIDKTLTILSPHYAIASLESITGTSRYSIKKASMTDKVSLNPSSSFGGYCLIEDNHPAIEHLHKNELIPEQQRQTIKLNSYHHTIAYLEVDEFNTAGKGYVTPSYINAMKPQQIELSKIHHPDYLINADIINQMSRNALDDKIHNQLVTGFGVRSKSHPDRTKLIGQIDQEFIENKAMLPVGFDFAMWNCAYPDQQTEFLAGNEWLTLTNLCHKKTKAATINNKGDIQLKLYLPEVLAYLALESSNPTIMPTELPMKLDTVIVSPDTQTVNLVWRSLIIDNYQPKKATLVVMDRQSQDMLSEQYFQ